MSLTLAYECRLFGDILDGLLYGTQAGNLPFVQAHRRRETLKEAKAGISSCALIFSTFRQSRTAVPPAYLLPGANSHSDRAQRFLNRKSICRAVRKPHAETAGSVALSALMDGKKGYWRGRQRPVRSIAICSVDRGHVFEVAAGNLRLQRSGVEQRRKVPLCLRDVFERFSGRKIDLLSHVASAKFGVFWSVSFPLPQPLRTHEAAKTGGRFREFLFQKAGVEAARDRSTQGYEALDQRSQSRRYRS